MRAHDGTMQAGPRQARLAELPPEATAGVGLILAAASTDAALPAGWIDYRDSNAGTLRATQRANLSHTVPPAMTPRRTLRNELA